MKLLTEFKKQVSLLGPLKRVWITSFNLSIEFVETHLLPVVVGMDAPKHRMDYETLQKELIDQGIDLRVFCDKRMMNQLDTKRTSIDVIGVSPRSIEYLSEESLFHPKVIYLEGKNGKAILGAGSANLTVNGWGRNQEVYAFRKVSTEIQSREIRLFFRLLVEDERIVFGKNFWGGDEQWKFVHSFQKESFLTQLLNNEDKELAVWSPYFPRDIALFIDKIKDAVDLGELKVHITPDRVEGKYIRTQWSDNLGSLINNENVNFYNNAIKKHENTDLCHAKVWKTSTKLAIGSWNFTGPGSNNLTDSDSNWSALNNIEAGFIFDDETKISSALGVKFNADRDDFASKELLDEEALVVQLEIPFDIRVCFDWERQEYTFFGEWCHSGVKENYQIKLPDIEELCIPTRRAKADIGMPSILISSPKELLTQHTFDIILNGDSVYRGLIIETKILDRRVQAYDNLNDLLDSLIVQANFDGANCTSTREELQADSDLFEDGTENNSVVSESTTSYFRLFQAISNFEKHLEAVNSPEQLNKLVFIHPGCLFEMCEKINKRINSELDKSDPEIFTWFLVEEFNGLVRVALDKYNKVRRKGMPTSPPENKWGSLMLSSPDLPKKLSKELSKGKLRSYLKLIKKECNYA